MVGPIPQVSPHELAGWLWAYEVARLGGAALLRASPSKRPCPKVSPHIAGNRLSVDGKALKLAPRLLVSVLCPLVGQARWEPAEALYTGWGA